MKELMIMMATMMPEEKLLNDLKDAIEDYLILPTNEKRDEIAMFSTMVVIKHDTNGDAKNAVDMIKKMEKLEKQSNIFNVNGN